MVRREHSASAGLVPVTGTYDQVRVGSLIRGNRGTLDDVWEVLEFRNPEQFDHDVTPWFLIENRATKQRAAIEPRIKTRPVTFMVPESSVDPAEAKPKLDPATVGPRDRLTDADAVALLVEELGAKSISWTDNQTGAVYCPPYETMFGVWEEYVFHLETAHGMDLTEVVRNHSKSELVTMLTTMHGRAHRDGTRNPNPTLASRGFPHDHPDPDLEIPFGPGMRAQIRERKKAAAKKSVSPTEM